MRVEAITPAIGAEISGIDLNNVSDDIADAIYEALITHHVIFFRGQDVSPAAHVQLAQTFGEMEPPHPIYPSCEGFPNIMVLENNADNPPDTDGWHTDVTYKPNPPFASLLIARKVPKVGGDTLWMSQCAAYDALPAEMKALLAGKQAVHDMGDFRNNFAVDDNPAEAITAAHQRFGSAVHPVVRKHPRSGRPFLFVNEAFTNQIVGMRMAESNSLLQHLYQHMNQPQFQMRFRWSEGAVAMWDNRCTQHFATADYMPHHRIMNRITITNDRRVL
ncbi:MAG: taurine dioxygenase [Pikeienuella sp.]